MLLQNIFGYIRAKNYVKINVFKKGIQKCSQGPRLRAIPLENRGIAALTNCRACLIKLRLLVYISKQGQKHLLKGAVSNDSIRLG